MQQNLRQELIVLVQQVTHFNLAMRHPSLTPIELLSHHLLLILHQAHQPLTEHHLIEQLPISTTRLHAALDLLLTKHAIIPYTNTESDSLQLPAFDITLTGRVQAHALTSWTDLLIRFIPKATPQALRELRQSLLACLRRHRHTSPFTPTVSPVSSASHFKIPTSPVNRTTAPT